MKLPAETMAAFLASTLSDLLEKHVELVSSGDCGFWDAEEEPEVIAAREALAAYRGETE